MHTLLQDVRYGARLLRRVPGFAAVAVLTLALGIGANTAIFTVINAVLLRPLPYPDADRLVMVWQDQRRLGGPADEWLTPGNYADLRQESGLFAGLAVLTGWLTTFTGQGDPEPVPGEQVSHEYFSVLGISPALGRAFTQADDVPNAPRVVIISEGLWKRRFGGDPLAVGSTMTLNGEAHEIVGVLPAGFRPIVNSRADLWRPLRLNVANPARGLVVLRSVARLKAGVPLDRAQAAATAIAGRLELAHPDYNEKTDFSLTPLKERVVGAARPGLVALAGAVAFVLLIACANIANLLLARGSVRGRELAIRAALGAGRGRIARQLLTESVLLAGVGGVAGLGIGVWAVDALVALAPAGTPRLTEIGLDSRVLAFAAVLTLITGLVFGLVPAIQTGRGELVGSLKDGARASGGRAGRGARRALIAAEMALALVLLTGAGLLLQTFVRLQAADLGFRPDGVLVAFVNPPRANYGSAAALRTLYDQVLEKSAALPGIETAALASVLPLSGDSDMSFAIDGQPPPRSAADAPVTWYRLVSASYFDAMGMRLVRGRAFVNGEPPPSIVVNESMARRYFAGRDAIGGRVRFGGPEAPWFTIIGVVADARVRGARAAPRVETFIPYWQRPEPGMNVVIKAAGSPRRLAEPLKQAIYSLDRNLPISNVTTLTEIVSSSIEGPRFVASLAAAFAMLALALAGIGIYGVMAYTVSQRTREIGVRIALGARRGSVFRLVLGDALRLVAIGLVAGLGGSLVVARWLTAQLFGVSPADPVTLVATSAILVAAASLASVIPARRATAVDPIVALRTE